MIGKLSIGEIIPLPQTRDGGELRATVSARAESALALDNVVPFARPGANDNARNVLIPADLARVPANAGRNRMRRIVAAALSVLAHGGLLALLLLHEEPPLASIGIEVISVELVLGATAPAGAAVAPGENETQSISAPETQSTDTSEAAQKATEQPQDIAVAEKETASEVKIEPPVSELPQQVEAAVAPQEQPPEPPVAIMEPQPEKPVQKKPESKPEVRKQAAPPKPVKEAAPAPERRRIAAPTQDRPAREAKASTPSSQANNVGVGRSSDDTNYRGLVAAHLARYKQYPADARSRGEGGTATVTFTVGGGGGVTAARLVRGSGVASIDAEVQAMVRRASPFPAPPAGRAQSFTVPVSFRLN